MELRFPGAGDLKGHADAGVGGTITAGRLCSYSHGLDLGLVQADICNRSRKEDLEAAIAAQNGLEAAVTAVPVKVRSFLIGLDRLFGLESGAAEAP